jgi:hypothetical protein
VNEDSGLSPIKLEVVMGILFIMVMCVVCPIIYLMRNSNSGATQMFSEKAKKPRHSAVEMTDSNPTDHV